MSFQVVTGGAGFIGSHLVERLLAEGQRVVILDNFSTGREENLSDFRSNPRLEVRKASILDDAELARAFRGADCVYHQAAVPSVQKSVDRPQETHDVNVTGTLKVLLAARETGVRRVLYASSSSVYGDSEELPKREDFAPRPLSPYALQKYAGEAYAGLFSTLYGTATTALRYFNVFGPRQDPTSEYAAVIPRFVTAMLKGESPVIYGDGEQSRDFTYVANVAEANLTAAASKGAEGAVMNVALGQQISLNQLVSILNGILGTAIRPVYQPARAGDVRHSVASIDRARQLIGFRPSVTLEDGLKRTVEWYSARLVRS